MAPMACQFHAPPSRISSQHSDRRFGKCYVAKLLDWIRESWLDQVVLLAHERVHDPDGTPRPDLGSMFVPNDIVLDLGRRYPEFLPGVSIHPARRDAIDELNRCADLGAVLMKCLPNCQ